MGRQTMNLTILLTFGIMFWVYQKKPKGDRLYAGKDKKIETSRQRIL
jgi:hypothetical protein